MKVVMVAVISINGKITRGLSGNIYEWSSQEDKDHFIKVRDKHDLIVMGSGTYEAIRSFLQPSSDKLRIVLTKNPKKYKKEEVLGQLEFSSETPRQLYKRCMIDHTSLMLVGGSKIYASFATAGLIDEIYLTIEPVVFGKGKPLFADADFENKFRLVSMKRLNTQGTILLRYLKA